jgi:3-dehydroshikimate dehydratase
LGAPAIRVWAGKRGSAEADENYRERVIDQASQLATLAAEAGIVVCYEYHIDTLTDTDASALALLRATADQPAMKTLWQPPHERPVEENVASLRGVLPWLHHVHVFHWPKRGERAALADGAARWRAYLDVLRADNRRDWPLLLEFVRGDDPAQLRADAATLHGWIAQ